MKTPKFIMLFVLFTLAGNTAKAQCIDRIFYLNDPAVNPCEYVGILDSDPINCFNPNWDYTWRIINPVTGNQLYPSQSGFAFNQVLDLFGGYQYRLEIDQNGDGNPEAVEDAQFTTCQPCSPGTVEIEFLNCTPDGVITNGCHIQITGRLPALNGVGVNPTGTIILTDLPTGQEQCGGIGPADFIFIDIPVTFIPNNISNLDEGGQLVISEDFDIDLSRGCHQATVIFEINNGSIDHNGAGPCTELSITSETFRCVSVCPPYEPGEDQCAVIKGIECCSAYACGSYFPPENAECCEGIEGQRPEMSNILLRQEESQSNYLIQPNPVDYTLRIHLPADVDHTDGIVSVFDMDGRLKKEEHVGVQSLFKSIDVSDLTSGAYIVVIQATDRVVFKEKFIITR